MDVTRWYAPTAATSCVTSVKRISQRTVTAEDLATTIFTAPARPVLFSMFRRSTRHQEEADAAEKAAIEKAKAEYEGVDEKELEIETASSCERNPKSSTQVGIAEATTAL